MKTNLKDNIWIEGFDDAGKVRKTFAYQNLVPIIFVGKTSEIPEEIARECVGRGYIMLVNYYKSHDGKTVCSPNEFILSACDKPYCVIYKTE